MIFCLMKHKLFIPVLLTAFTLLLAGCGEKSSGAQGSGAAAPMASSSQQAWPQGLRWTIFPVPSIGVKAR